MRHEVADFRMPESGVRAIEVNGRHIAVFAAGNDLLAVDELCPHRAGPLSEGKREGDAIICPWHAAKFDLRTGQQIFGPAPRGLRTYAVALQGTTLAVEIP